MSGDAPCGQPRLARNNLWLNYGPSVGTASGGGRFKI